MGAVHFTSFLSLVLLVRMSYNGPILQDSPTTLVSYGDSGISLGNAFGRFPWIEMSRLSYGPVWCVHGKRPPTNLLRVFSIHWTTRGTPGHTLLWTLSPVLPHRLGITPSSPWLNVYPRLSTSFLSQNSLPQQRLGTSLWGMFFISTVSLKILRQTEDPNSFPTSGELSALRWSLSESLIRVSSAVQWSSGVGQSEFGECPEMCGGLNPCFLELVPTLGGVCP